MKGRAASPALNHELKKTIPWAISSDLYSGCMYFRSCENRADGPTRHRDPDPPDVAVPAWVDEVAEGRFDSFDRWMLDKGAPSLVDDLPFEEIGGFDETTLLPNAKVREGRRTACGVDASSATATVPSRKVTFDESFLGREAVEILASFNDDQFFFKGESLHVACKGALDLYSGCYGVAKEMIRCNAPWVLSFEIKRSHSENLLDSEVQRKILRLVQLGIFGSVFAAPICSSFSVAVTPPVRSRRYPRGVPGLRASMRYKVTCGNQHADFVASVVTECEASSTYYGVENPDTSWLWRQRRWRRFYASDHREVFRVCFCRFGAAWKKPTRIATNCCLKGRSMWCTCRQRHLQLRGNHPLRKIPWTLVAEPYPRGLNKVLAAGLCSSYGWCSDRKLKVAACCKAGTLRVGEASNPGPPRGSLEEVQVVSEATRALESRQLEAFLSWCRSCIDSDFLEDIFDRVPIFMVQCLRTYGDLMYQRNGSLSNLRHLLLACQKWKPMSKPFMTSAWDMVDRWAQVRPVTHRSPIPESVVRALCVVGWHFKWYTWVGAVVLSFFGAGRLGEVMQCIRSDLVFPKDLLERGHSPIFLKLRRFKSLGRQPAHVQHMKVSDEQACRILSKVFFSLDADAPLFGASAYQFRKRWDMAMEALTGKDAVRLTPGGLRAGAAVHHYKKGMAIADLMWVMRLRSQTTLESYLQEVAALNVLVALSKSSRSNIALMSRSFDFLAA